MYRIKTLNKISKIGLKYFQESDYRLTNEAVPAEGIILRSYKMSEEHLTEELYESFGGRGFLATQKWPVFDESKTVEDVVEMAVQVNGKLKGVISVPADDEEENVLKAALENEKVRIALEGMTVVKSIVINNKIVNLVVKLL